MPATATAPAPRPDPGPFVWASPRGCARVLRSRIAAADAQWRAASDALLAPLTGTNTTRFSRRTLAARFGTDWRALPGKLGRLKLRIAPSDVLEIRLAPFGISWDGRDGDDPGIALIVRSVSLGQAPTDDTRIIAVVGLHALARRFERAIAGKRDEKAALRDLAALCDLAAWKPGLRGLVAEFDIAAPGGGFWRGSVMKFQDGAPAAAVRTFVR